MKNAKKLACVLLALAMVFAMAIPVFATDPAAPTTTAAPTTAPTYLTGGKITIEDAIPGHDYNAYQLLYLESYDAATGAYSYKAMPNWETWLKAQTTYLTFDEQGYVTWVDAVSPDTNEAKAAEFAKLAQAQAATLPAADKTATAPAAAEGAANSTVEFTGLNLGYWLVDTSVGSLCALNTTNPEVKMEEKNDVPTVDKTITGVNDEAYNPAVNDNSASIGDTVKFQTVINAKKGAQNYVLHDEMTEGLALNKDVAVKVGDTALTAGTDYTVAYGNDTPDTITDNCDFEITFTKDYLDTITADTAITVTYSAVLTPAAVIGIQTDDAGVQFGNTNKTKLDYGDKHSTAWDKTETYTFRFDVVKTDDSNKVLEGAEFVLYDAETDGNIIPLTLVDGVYVVATNTTADPDLRIPAGQATIKGLANGTYWLEETKAPTGYNKLAARQKVTINNANLDAEVTDGTWTAGGVQVINKTGAVMPSTGGIGTTIFYVVGAVLLVGAGMLLVVRRRMNAAKATDK